MKFFLTVFMLCISGFTVANPTANLLTVQEKLAALQTSVDGRLGVSAINAANGARIDYRAKERFPFCSTVKFMVVGAILKKSLTDSKLLQQKIHYTQKDIDIADSYSPITEKHLGEGMTIAQLGRAAIFSDSTAMNLLLKQLGGAKAVTAFARSIGDNKFRLDREEPTLNSAIPGDPRDTTTPAGMAKNLQTLMLGNALASPQRELLVSWMKENNTGDNRIRAGVPTGWGVGDKTGTCSYGSTNDIGVIWPAKCAPIAIAVYFTQPKKDAKARDDLIAAATRIVISKFAETDSCLKSNP